MLVLIDPHCDDFIYRPLTYFIFRKKAFRKYAYLDIALRSYDKLFVYFTYENSSMPPRIFSKLPKVLKMVLIKLEISFWRRINKIDLEEYKIVGQKSEKSAFIFGYKKFDILSVVLPKFKDVYVHLSHYHTFQDLDYSNYSNLTFCADNNIAAFDFFKKKFSWYEKRIIIVPFCVSDRFKVLHEFERIKKCCVTGTYHDIPVSKVDFGIYNSRGNTTLHPLRFELAQGNWPFLVKRLNLYGKNIFEVFQRSYLKFDIVRFYNSFDYAVVPGEGNGLIAIGSLEAIACGCSIFLTSWEADGLFESNEYFEYDGGLDDLIAKCQAYTDSGDELSWNVKSRLLDRFKADNLVQRFRSSFENLW